jgi:RimJ/RimL family protein N-acetyltransferase
MSYFHFPKLQPSAQLHYERLTMNNFEQLYELFKNDKNPFVLENFKDLEEAKLYTEDRIEAKTLPKWAGCDWLIKTQPAIYAGILHLYDLNIATGSHTCCIGVTIAEPFRKQGFATEAIQHLLKYTFAHFEHIDTVIAYSKPENSNMARLLQKLNFSPDHEKKFIYSDIYSYFTFEKKNR